jgi:hypothetical protein
MSVHEESWTPLGVVAAGPTLATGESTEVRSLVSFAPDGKRNLVVIGAAGGAVYAKRPNSYQKPRWEVVVKMDDGSQRIVQQPYEPFVREGDHVRVRGTQLELVDS